MLRAAKLFTCTGMATKPEQRAALHTHHNQLRLVIKAATWKRAHELYVAHQGHITLNYLRTYGSISGNREQLAVSADSVEGIWWTTLSSADAEYRMLWASPAGDEAPSAGPGNTGDNR